MCSCIKVILVDYLRLINSNVYKGHALHFVFDWCSRKGRMCKGVDKDNEKALQLLKGADLLMIKNAVSACT